MKGLPFAGSAGAAGGGAAALPEIVEKNAGELERELGRKGRAETVGMAACGADAEALIAATVDVLRNSEERPAASAGSAPVHG